MIRLALETGTIIGIRDSSRQESSERMLDEVLYRSYLSRLRVSLENERRYFEKTGEGLEVTRSEQHVESLVEIGKRRISLELVKEFQECLADADKLYEREERAKIDAWIRDHEEQLS